jgi:hypothetical protein
LANARKATRNLERVKAGEFDPALVHRALMTKVRDAED